MAMKAVGVRVLKNNLSRYLQEVRAGEHIWVTDRDEVIAEIHRPTSPVPGKVTRWEAFLNQEERRGRLRRPVRNDVAMKVFPALPGDVDVAAIIEDSRADRR